MARNQQVNVFFIIPSGWTYPLTGNINKPFPAYFLGPCTSRVKAGISRASFRQCDVLQEVRLLWVGSAPHVCPCGETEREDTTVDVTLRYDLNICLHPAEQRSIVSLSRATPCWQLPCACKPIPHFSFFLKKSFYFSFPLFSLSVSLLIFLCLLVLSLSNSPSFNLLVSYCVCYSFALPRHASLSSTHQAPLFLLSPLLSCCLRISQREIRDVG